MPKKVDPRYVPKYGRSRCVYCKRVVSWKEIEKKLAKWTERSNLAGGVVDELAHTYDCENRRIRPGSIR